ncbi:MAG: hypothetical protein Q9201_000316 [Fulgogasparrea decipioides]
MDLLHDIQSHLAEVAADPAGKVLDGRLLEKFDGQVTESISETERDALICQLAELLPILQQDPTPATTLIQVIVRPASYTFSRVLEIRPPVDLQAGLKAPSPPINLLTLALLEKAAFSRSDAGIVAGKPDVVAALIELWLSISDTAVAQRAHEVLLGLLTADDDGQPPVTAAYNQSLMWRRVFRDKDIYGSIYRICSLSNAGQKGQLSKRDKTVAQARLLALLAKIDCESIRLSQIAEVENQFGVTDGGLLEFAALKMVEYEDDVLMHMTLVDFFAELLKPNHSFVQAVEIYDHDPCPSETLHFLMAKGLHSRTLSYYLDSTKQSSLDLTYLYTRAANYLATYASSYPSHFLHSPTIAEKTMFRLSEVLGTMSPGRWAQGLTPKHDLHVLASLPGLALLPRPAFTSPLFLLPAKPPNADALQTLATVFHGPRNQGLSDESVQSNGDSLQRATARALYFLYVDRNPTLWQEVVKAAEIVALKEAALAAIALMKAVITANWGPLLSDADEDQPELPTEAQLAEKCHSSQHLPPTGLLAILTPPAMEAVLPYLLRPAQTFSNLVGGGKGDVESAAYRVAAAKFDLLTSLKPRLQEVAQETGQLEDVVAVVNRRLALGVLGGNSEVGGNVGTLEL